MFLVEYTAPYTGVTRTQEFYTRSEAESMAALYRSSGTRASVRYQSLRSTY